MNDEPQYSRGVVLAGAAWLATGLLLVGAWLSWALGGEANRDFTLLFSQTACVGSAAAAVAHLRCYAARICRLIRVANGLQRPGGELREFTPRDR